MSAGRNSRRRRRKRGWGSHLLRVLCVLALGAALYYGATVFFQVETVAVSGNSRYAQEQIIEAAGIQTGDNLFRMNKNRMAQDVLQKLPYIEELTIRRGYPNSVIIQVKEWAAAARVEKPDARPDYVDETAELAQEDWLISVGGKLLETASADSQGIEVTGLTVLAPRAGTGVAVPQEEQGKLSALLTLLQNLNTREELDRVSLVDLSSAACMVLRYDGRFTVKMSYSKDIGYQLRVLAEVAKDQLEGQTGTVDLTQKDYAAGFTPD